MIYDLAIIGSGFAGLAAVKKAMEKGLTTCLIARDGGATRHFSGAFDLIEPRWWQPELGPANYPSLRLALDRFILGHPEHLYTRLAENQSDFSENLINEARTFFSYYGIPVISDEQMIVVFGSAGLIKPTGFALSTQGLRVGELAAAGDALYVDFPYLREYPARQIAQQCQAFFNSVRVERFDVLCPPRLSPLAGYLDLFEDRQNFERLKDFLKRKKNGARIIFLPPLLGVKNYQTYHRELEEALGVRVVELLATLPSAAGLRLAHHLEAFFASSGITRVAGEVTAFTREAKKIQYLTVRDARGEESVVMAKAYILATGKFIGGGIKKTNEFREAIFDLPLFAMGHAVSPHTRISKLLDLRVRQKQPIMDVGILTNETGHPIERTARLPKFENLKACGHVLCGFDFSRDRCGFGVSLASALHCLQSLFL